MDARNVIALLAEHYGIHASDLTPVSGGTSALDFRVSSPQGVFFLKVYPRERANTGLWTSKINSYIPVLQWLRQQPELAPHLPEPLPTLAGAFFCQDSAQILLLYAFLAGRVLPDNALLPARVETFARLTATLHKLPCASPPCPPSESEDYAALFLPELEGLLAGNWEYRLSAEVWRMARPFAGPIRQRALQLSQLQATLRESKPPLVLCHTDLHHWNLMNCSGRLVILDWEGLRRAPAESDLMFILSLPYAAEFMRVYQEQRPDFAPNSAALRFVIIRRKLEDIWLFMRALSLDKMEASALEQNQRWLRECLNELGEERFSVG